MTETIEVMKPLDHIRLRSGMYVGSTDTAETLLKELVDNSVDELLNGYAKRIDIENNHKDGYYMIRDNGRGLPLGKKADYDNQISAKLLFTELYSGGKFSKDNYKYSSGLHGVGLTACNALSSKTLVRVRDTKKVHGNGYYILELSRGVVVSEQFVDSIDDEDTWWNTEVTVYPDLDIFRSVKCDVREIQLQLAAKIVPDATITYNGKVIEPLNFGKVVDSKLLLEKLLTVNVSQGTTTYEIMFGWSDSLFDLIGRGSVNVSQCNQGIHVQDCIKQISRALSLICTDLTVDDGRLGLRLFVNAVVSEPEYSSQTKEKLTHIKDFHISNLELSDKFNDKGEKIPLPYDHVDNQDIWKLKELICQTVKTELKKHETLTEIVCRRIVEYKKLTQQLSTAEFINQLVKIGTDSRTSKSVAGITEASSADRSKCELYVCEGRSAAGNLYKSRDKKFQAVLPLRGKPLNAASNGDIKEILENKEMITLINGIGAGIKPNVDLSAMRYGKIVIATDADFDGLNIRAILVGALTYLTPELIEGGFVYIAIPPLYAQNDKFVYDEKDLIAGKPFERFKGLGSMDPDEIYEAIMKPETRRLVQLTMTQDQRSRVLDVVTDSATRKRIMINSGKLIDSLT